MRLVAEAIGVAFEGRLIRMKEDACTVRKCNITLQRDVYHTTSSRLMCREEPRFMQALSPSLSKIGPFKFVSEVCTNDAGEEWQ